MPSMRGRGSRSVLKMAARSHFAGDPCGKHPNTREALRNVRAGEGAESGPSTASMNSCAAGKGRNFAEPGRTAPPEEQGIAAGGRGQLKHTDAGHTRR